MTHSFLGLRRALGPAVFMVALLAPLRADAQFMTTTHASCVGGAIGCTQMDFFIEFLGLTGPTTLDAFSLAVQDAQFAFASPGTTEAEDALGFNFYNPTVSADGQTLFGTFDFGAFLDPSATSILRVRAEMASIPAEFVDPNTMTYAYAMIAGGETVASGRFDPAPPVTATPEPATMTLLGTGLFGLAGWARRRNAHQDVVESV